MMKILVVEDDQSLKETITIALSDDYEVIAIDLIFCLVYRYSMIKTDSFPWIVHIHRVS